MIRHTRLQGDWSSDVCSSDLATSRLEGARSTRTPNGNLETFCSCSMLLHLFLLPDRGRAKLHRAVQRLTGLFALATQGLRRGPLLAVACSTQVRPVRPVPALGSVCLSQGCTTRLGKNLLH